MQESIFTKIINGEIPCHKVYEDDSTLAFLDIHPKQPGHILVIPKSQVEYIWDLNDKDYDAIMYASKKVAQRIREVLNPSRVAMQVEGIGVPHAHIHVFPFETTAQFHADPDQSADPDHQALAIMAEKLAF